MSKQPFTFLLDEDTQWNLEVIANRYEISLSTLISGSLKYIIYLFANHLIDVEAEEQVTIKPRRVEMDSNFPIEVQDE